MRFPVFARGTRPGTDRPILRKSRKYVSEQIESGRADWVDPLDPAKGIVCREKIYFGPREVPVATVEVSSIPPDAGLKYVPAKTWKNPTLPRLYARTLANSAPVWDWSQELPA